HTEDFQKFSINFWKLLFFNKLHSEFELSLFTSKDFSLVIFRAGYINHFLFAFLHTNDAVLEATNHTARAEFKSALFTRASFKFLESTRTFKLESHLRVVYSRAFGFTRAISMYLKSFGHLLNSLIVDFSCFTLTFQALEIHFNFWIT